jgi:hypothetical protein
MTMMICWTCEGQTKNAVIYRLLKFLHSDASFWLTVLVGHLGFSLWALWSRVLHYLAAGLK